MVLASHGRHLAGVPWFAHFGWFGVELFFVLSGYLIGAILLRLANNAGPRSVRRFISRRWFRTFPAYFVALGFAALVTYLGFRGGDLSVLPQYLVFGQNFAWRHPSFFGEAWSLSVEEWFYVLAPASLLLLKYLRWLTPTEQLAIAFTMLYLLSTFGRLWLSLEAGGSLNWGSDIRKVTWLRFDSIALGGLAIVLRKNSYHLFAKLRLLALIGAASLPVVYFAVPDFRDTTFGQSAFFNLASLAGLGLILVGDYLSISPWLIWTSRQIAKLSYGLYLTHLSVLAILSELLFVGGFLGFLIFILASIVVAVVLYGIVERPFLRLRNARFAELDSSEGGGKLWNS